MKREQRVQFRRSGSGSLIRQSEQEQEEEGRSHLNEEGGHVRFRSGF